MKIVWLVNDLFINNFITVYYECEKREDVQLVVVATEHLDLYGGKSISSHEVAEFLRSKNVKCIDSVNETTGELLDIGSLQPDYIFTTTPYDIYYPTPYRSDYTAQYAKLCNVAYGAYVIETVGKYSGYEDTPYKRALSFLFSGSVLESNQKDYRAIGSLKLDEYAFYGRKAVSCLWRQQPDCLRVVWKPRWTLDAQDSNLMRYLSDFVQYVQFNPDVDFVFLEHPLLQETVRQANPEISKAFYDAYESLKTMQNFHICADSDFLDTVLSADVLIADHGSVLFEAAAMGVDVIYTPTNETLNALGRKIVEKNCAVSDFVQLENALKQAKAKKCQNMPRKAKWPETDEFALVPPDHLSAAQYLLQILFEDYRETESNLQYYKSRISNLLKEKWAMSEKIAWQEKELSRVYAENTEVWKKYHEMEQLCHAQGERNPDTKEDNENKKTIVDWKRKLFKKNN